MTSVACCRIDCGMVSPRAWAVLRLTTKSNVVGCSIGQVGRLGALEDLVDVGGGAPERVEAVRPVGHQAASNVQNP